MSSTALALFVVGCHQKESPSESALNLPYVGSRKPISDTYFDSYGTRELVYQETKAYGEIVAELRKLEKAGILALSNEQRERIIFRIIGADGIAPRSRIIAYKNKIYDQNLKDSKPGSGVVIQFWLANAPVPKGK